MAFRGAGFGAGFGCQASGDLTPGFGCQAFGAGVGCQASGDLGLGVEGEGYRRRVCHACSFNHTGVLGHGAYVHLRHSRIDIASAQGFGCGSRVKSFVVMPVVSIMTASYFSLRAERDLNALTRSPRTVQHTQPLSIEITSCGMSRGLGLRRCLGFRV